jgi:hypothetical protein
MPRRNLLHDIYIIAGIVISILIIIFSAILAITRTNLLGRAAETTSGGQLSKENSYVFASPIYAKADGSSIIRITVFLLNDQGLGVEGKKVEIKTAPQLQINSISSTTESFGRAIFDVTSANSGNYSISAVSEGITLPQTVSISFR